MNSKAYSTFNHKPNTAEQGFTLIELLITMLLGAIISAAVIQVFVTSQRSDRIQNSGSEIQSTSIYGMQSIEKQVRLANLGNNGLPINERTFDAGVAFTAEDDGVEESTDTGSEVPSFANVIGRLDGAAVSTEYLTNGGDVLQGFSGRGLSNTDIPSDQLTIQYRNTINQTMFDCEGVAIAANEMVIQRYFVKDAGGGTSTRKNLELRCDAGRIVDGAAIANSNAFNRTINNFTDDGVVVINNVDQFNIKLELQRVNFNRATGVTTADFVDMTPAEYNALTITDKPFLTNIRLAIIARSDSNSPEDGSDDFDIFGTQQSLTADDNADKYLRRVFESNILLRNARIVSAS